MLKKRCKLSPPTSQPEILLPGEIKIEVPGNELAIRRNEFTEISVPSCPTCGEVFPSGGSDLEIHSCPEVTQDVSPSHLCGRIIPTNRGKGADYKDFQKLSDINSRHDDKFGDHVAGIQNAQTATTNIPKIIYGGPIPSSLPYNSSGDGVNPTNWTCKEEEGDTELSNHPILEGHVGHTQSTDIATSSPHIAESSSRFREADESPLFDGICVIKKENFPDSTLFQADEHELAELEEDENIEIKHEIIVDNLKSVPDLLPPAVRLDAKTPKGSSEFGCLICEKIFRKKGHLKRHVLTHQPEKPFGCNFCAKRFAAKCSLQIHLVNFHKLDSKPIQCDDCHLRFSLAEELNKHKGSRCIRKSYPCTHCEIQFPSPSELDVHVETSHPEKVLKCKLCERTFTRNYNLTRHEKIHREEKLDCVVCNRKIASKDYLKLHLQEHELKMKDKSLSCPFCEKGFAIAENLEAHIEFHEQLDERPFACDLCEVRFRYQERLDKHNDSHGSAEGKIYPCSYCEKKFHRKFNFIRHERSHTHGRRKPKDHPKKKTSS